MRLTALCRCSLIAATGLVPMSAAADVVVDWNERALASVTAVKQPTPAAARSMAIVHVAMFDAVNAVERRYAPYAWQRAAPAGSNAEAAAVAAAHAALVALFPEQAAALDADYAASLAKIPDGAAKTAGVTLGEEVAAAIVALRAEDGSRAAVAHRPQTTPGAYVLTALPLGSHWGGVTPWAMADGAQFRPPPPPALESPVWARDYEEVKEFGGKKSTRRTPEQTDIARFWTITGPASWDPLMRGLAAAAPGRTLIDNARLFALVEMAGSDALVAVFDAKYAYNFWRPITAIRNGDIDGNLATERVPDWEPLVETPMHPEYPCAHCITSSAISVVLEAEFGDVPIPTITLTGAGAPDVVRQFNSVKDYVQEVAAARIYGGIHYRTSAEVGQQMGRKIGALVVAEQLRPVDRRAHIDVPRN